MMSLRTKPCLIHAGAQEASPLTESSRIDQSGIQVPRLLAVFLGLSTVPDKKGDAGASPGVHPVWGVLPREEPTNAAFPRQGVSAPFPIEHWAVPRSLQQPL